MSENTENTAEAGDNTQPGQEQEQVQSFSQDDVNRIVQERLQRERDKFSDYDELKAAAERAQELESHADVLRSLISTGPVVRGQEKRPDAVSADPLQEFARNLFAQAD